MANKYDLKIKSQTLAAGTEEVLGKVDVGKTRFVCFVKISAPAATTVTLASDEDSATVDAGSTVKDITQFTSAGILAFPDNIDVDNPMFAVAENMYLNVKGTVGDSITVVYFDE